MANNPPLFRRMARRFSTPAQTRGKELKQFADSVGLVYFGSVDQHDDDHDTIRGMTASTSHRDTHFATGSYDGYDLAVVDRFDVHTDAFGAHHNRAWLIYRITLKNPTNIPDVILAPRAHTSLYEPMIRLHRHLTDLTPQTATATDEFHARYHVYGNPTDSTAINALLPGTITNIIAARLWPHGVEIEGKCLYVYISEVAVTRSLLDASLDAALWLARQSDSSAA